MGEKIEQGFTPLPESDDLLSIHSSLNTPLVVIRPDGSIEYGPDYTPDEAARILWETVASYGMAMWQTMARAAGWTPPENSDTNKEN